jgi:hypothetical protein
MSARCTCGIRMGTYFGSAKGLRMWHRKQDKREMKLVSGGPYAGFAWRAFDFPSILLPRSLSSGFPLSRHGSPSLNFNFQTSNQ